MMQKKKTRPRSKSRVSMQYLTKQIQKNLYFDFRDATVCFYNARKRMYQNTVVRKSWLLYLYTYDAARVLSPYGQD